MVLLSHVPIDSEIATLLAERNLQVIVIDPLDERPTSGDYASVMTQNIQRLQLLVIGSESTRQTNQKAVRMSPLTA